MNTKPFLTAGLVVGFVCNLAVAQVVVEQAGVLTDAEGRTLYTFDKDSAGKSVCIADCEAAWPPFMAKADAKSNGRYTVVIRDDGSKQWALDRKPLYFFAADTRPGDIRGDGQGGLWHVAKAGASKSAKSTSTGYGAYSSDAYSYNGD